MSEYALKDRLQINNVRVFTSTGTITMANEGVLIVKKAVGAASAVTLPPNPNRGDHRIIKDGLGDAATNNITITPAAGNVDGAATYVISENYGGVILEYNGTEWGVVAQTNAVSSAELGFLNGVTAGTAAASKAVVLDASLNIASINAATITTTNSTTVNAGSANVTGSLALTSATAVAAAGTVIANAAALSGSLNIVSGADDAKGVVLPASSAGLLVAVYSSQATNGLKVYPPVSSAINGGSANAAVVMEGKTLGIFLCTNATNWSALFTANS